MEVIEGAVNIDFNGYLVVTSGTFDGVHVGHRQIIERIGRLAREKNGKSAVITFWPHPRYVLRNATNELKLLSTWKEKEYLLRKSGIDYLIKIPFTLEFSELSVNSFIQKVLVDALGTKMLVIGYDHRFGKNREGNFDYLKANASAFGFEVEEIPRQDIENIGISSSKIRAALLEGNIGRANEFLGYEYSIEGIVVKGNQIGSQLGFPTANLVVKEDFKLIPPDGIYAVLVEHHSRSYGGMLYIGPRPTLEKSTKTIEVNIFNFEQSIYGDPLKVSFLKLLREDRKFDSLDSLKHQLHLDRSKALEVLKQHRKDS